MKRKKYTTTTDYVKTTGLFTEKEVEQIRRQFHGYVNIDVKEGGVFDFPKLAADTAREAR